MVGAGVAGGGPVQQVRPVAVQERAEAQAVPPVPAAGDPHLVSAVRQGTRATQYPPPGSRLWRARPSGGGRPDPGLGALHSGPVSASLLQYNHGPGLQTLTPQLQRRSLGVVWSGQQGSAVLFVPLLLRPLQQCYCSAAASSSD